MCDTGEVNKIAELPAIESLDELMIQKVGLESLEKIEIKFPNLSVLDIKNNKILSVYNLDYISELSNLAELNISNNPIEIHPK
jgi:Leucine-rich repeat (LRR) protein